MPEARDRADYRRPDLPPPRRRFWRDSPALAKAVVRSGVFPAGRLKRFGSKAAGASLKIATAASSAASASGWRASASLNCGLVTVSIVANVTRLSTVGHRDLPFEVAPPVNRNTRATLASSENCCGPRIELRPAFPHPAGGVAYAAAFAYEPFRDRIARDAGQRRPHADDARAGDACGTRWVPGATAARIHLARDRPVLEQPPAHAVDERAAVTPDACQCI